MITLAHLLNSLRGEIPATSIQRALAATQAENTLPITAVTSDSREVNSGSVFVAVPGLKIDGHDYVMQAAGDGAAFIIGERPANEFALDDSRYLVVPDARLALGLLASELYGNPSREMLMIGVTGTSGKTTTAYIVESILKAAGKRVGLIGTVSFRIDGREIPSTHTTPGPVELQKLLRRMRDEGCDAVAMEVSSHALKQHRAIGIAFDGAVFTNLSPEHLDYHPDLEDYFQAKALLFGAQTERSARWGKETKFAIHLGDEAGVRLLRETSRSLESAGFAVPGDAKISAQGIQGIFSGVALESKLVGRFNAENIAGAAAIALACGISPAAVKKGVRDLDKVPGRLEGVTDPRGERVVLVDYAHKPDALEKVLEVLRPMRVGTGKLICVVGCGGDRDRAKRPLMGEIACRLADRVFFTSDNPRTEDPQKILGEIEKGCESAKNFERIVDRKTAIEHAIATTKKGDIVLIAGKGHEDYQIIGTEKIHFDDREIAANALAT